VRAGVGRGGEGKGDARGAPRARRVVRSRTAAWGGRKGWSVSVLIVTGTGTGVGKTVVTAAVAVLARERGAAVAVVKPAQTGVAGDGGAGGSEAGWAADGDLAEVRRLSGVDDLHELARYPDPLSPEAAARVSGR